MMLSFDVLFRFRSGLLVLKFTAAVGVFTWAYFPSRWGWLNDYCPFWHWWLEMSGSFD